MRRHRTALIGWMAVLGLLASSEMGVARRALVIGIDDYGAAAPMAGQHQDDRGWSNLRGAVNDADAIAALLVDHYGFPAEQIRVLRNGQATRTAILAGLDELAARTRVDEVVVFFFSGHGSQVALASNQEPDGMDESIVPADARRGASDIRDDELRRRLHRVLDRGGRLTVILDSCHSGSATRTPDATVRGIAPSRAVVENADRDAADGRSLEARGALVLTAAEPGEQAYESSQQGVVHGVFTHALLEALRGNGGEHSAQRVSRRAFTHVKRGRWGQTPTLAGNLEARRRTLFGTGHGVTSGDVATVVETVGDRMALDRGWLHGLTVGTRLVPERAGRMPLEIVEVVGLDRAWAKPIMVAPPGLSRPVVGTVYRVDAWAPPPASPMRIGPAQAIADDEDASTAIPISLAEHLQRHPLVRSGAVAWDDQRHRGPLDHRLETRLGPRGPEASWRSNDTLREEHAVRTPWRAFEGAAERHALLVDLRSLARAHAWRHIVSPPPQRFAFGLALRRVGSSALLDPDQPLVAGRTYEPVLWRGHPEAKAHVPSRYVYVFVLDRRGGSTLLFPRHGNVDNRLPAGRRQGPVIALGPDARFTIGPPFGRDTYILLTSSDPISDPWILEWDGVGVRDVGAMALDQLLAQAAAGSRVSVDPMRSQWSIERLLVTSMERK